MHEDQRIKISQYIDCELREKEDSALFHHLAGCDQCRGFLRSALRLRADLLDASAVSFPSVENQFEQGRQLGVFQVVKRRLIALTEKKMTLSYPMAVMAAFLLILLGSVMTLTRASWPDRPPADHQEVIYLSSIPEVRIVGHIHPESK